MTEDDTGLQRLDGGTLLCKLGLAQATLRWAQSSRFRLKALVEIDAIRRELARRNEKVPA